MNKEIENGREAFQDANPPGDLHVLFVRAGSESGYDPRPYIRVQADSLRARGIAVSDFYVPGGAILNYLRIVLPLRSLLRQHRVDVIHAHYGYCGIVGLFARRKERLVVSFMGTDLYGSVDAQSRINMQGRFNVLIARFLARRSHGIIVKSKHMLDYIPASCLGKTTVIPNGVDLERVSPKPRDEARTALGLPLDRAVVLFLGDPFDPRKNYDLFVSACSLLVSQNVHVSAPHPVTHEEVVLYLSAADVMVLTSTHEGSPNVVKEAMACNLPIVSVDVGDVAERLAGIRQCYVCTYEPGDLARKIDQVLGHNERSNGRESLVLGGLDTASIAKRIISLYRAVLFRRNKKSSIGNSWVSRTARL